MIGPEPLCTKCQHFHEDADFGLTCDAFPKGIPDEILVGGRDHRKPFKGDGGVRFQVKDERKPEAMV